MSNPSKIEVTRERIHHVLWDLAAKHAGKDREQITPEIRLIQDLGFDSLGTVEFTMELEEELGLDSLEGFAEDPLTTLGEMERRLCERLLK